MPLPLLLLSACAAVASPPTALPEPEPLVLGLVQDGEGEAVPAGIHQALAAELALRNLSLVKTWEAGPDAPKATAGRLARLREVAAEAGARHLLLVEVKPTFFAQLDGRYRWTVSVEVRTGGSEGEARLQEGRASLPVFLRFDHQRGEAALEAAGPEITRVATRALDAYLSSR